MEDTDPEKVSDEELRTLVHRWKRARWVLLVAMGFIVLTTLSVFGYLLMRDESRLVASCSFYRDVATANFVPSIKVKPPELLVRLVVDSRNSYMGQYCRGALPPPSAAVVKWAGYYHIPVG